MIESIIRKSNVHLDLNKETYLIHMRIALYMSVLAIYCAFVLFVHALIPAFFEFDGSKTIKKLIDIVNTRGQSRVVNLSPKDVADHS
jgi:hypothetical protein